MALTTEQLLLLNNLMYMDGKPFGTVADQEGRSIGEWLNTINTDAIDPDADYGSFMTGEDWQNIIDAVQSDPVLSSMTIKDTHVDNSNDGGGGRSAVFISEETGDAVVTFKGTQSEKEWADNFDGGNMSDTPCQENALEWYQQAYEENGLSNYEITVTGHSKGGNKSKYIAVLDETVDNCVSFDGQGFSDKFMEKYAGQIGQRQDVIENHNVDYDYVNLLLNDVGDTTYYYGQNLGKGGFLENHCPNTFMKFSEDGTFQMVSNPDGQPPEMQAVDEMFNNLLRSMTDDQRNDMLDVVNAFINQAFSIDANQSGTDIINMFIDLAMDPQYSDELSYLLAYLVEYEQANPELTAQINTVLSQFGMGDFSKYVDIVDDILSFEKDVPFIGTVTFDDIVDLISNHGNKLPDWLLGWLSDYLLKEHGISLTPEQMRTLLEIVVMTNDNMDRIRITDNGGDIKIPSASTPTGGAHAMAAKIQQMLIAAAQLQALRLSLDQVADSVSLLSNQITMSSSATIRRLLQTTANQVSCLSKETEQLGVALTEISTVYDRTENSVSATIGSKLHKS